MKLSNQDQFKIFLIVCALLSVVIGKILIAIRFDYPFLYIYGVAVTLTTLAVFYIAFEKYKDPYLLSKKMKKSKRKTPLVTCLVAARNEEKDIEKCITSLIEQTYTNKQIIFVNDASTDNTKKVLEKYAKKGEIELIGLSENIGKKRALAKAMLKAKGELFVFTDSDSLLAPDAVQKIVDIFNSDPLIGAVSGHCRAQNADKNLLTKIQDSWYEGQFSIRKAFESVYGAVSCVSGPLAAFRKETIYNFIPAWENDTFLGEEFRFATDRSLTGYVLGSKAIGKKLKEKYSDSPFVKEKNYPIKDWKVVYTKSAKTWTLVPDTLKKFLRQQTRWKKSFIRNLFFTGSFYWRKPLPVVLYYYFHTLFVILGPFIAFRHIIYLPLQGNIFSGILYLSGIVFIGFMFALAYSIENKGCPKWKYRPLMSLLSTLLLSWLLFYSIFTIRKKIWSRG